jgi:DEAD/DEAH box helicase domain-containing protein
LFREIKTEALKVLLPVQEFESEATINMFKAGLELGLKKYYKGNPQHLSIINYSEYNAKNSRFDKYLVLYDNIPGGTGYLEKLFSPADFTTVISKAYEAIRDCSCKAKGKDGCYRCIYTYSNQFIQDELSRAKAEILFKKIVDKSDAWETYTTGLGALTSNGQIEESELEDRFIRSLRNHLQNQNPLDFKFEDFIENGIVNYKFKITSGDYSFYYVIRPQYELGPTNGVKYNTRSDFYISLSSIEKDGIAIEDDGVLSSVKGIAIYLDGYTYHATEENCRFFEDLKKRTAIEESNSIISWTLTWADIEKFDAIEKEHDSSTKDFKRDSIFLDKVKFQKTIDSFRKLLGNSMMNEPLYNCKNSLERLLWLLSNPTKISEKQKKIGILLAMHQQQFGTPSSDIDSIDEVLNDPLKNIDNSLIAKDKSNGNFYVLPEVYITDDFAKTKVAVKISDLSIKSSIVVNNTNATLDKQTWEIFWQLYNLIQENCVVEFKKI